MANGTEWVKFMTERVVDYIETPREQRKQTRLEAKAAREPWLIRWFGLAPLGLKVWWHGRKNKTLE
ncbi:YqzE family protein [Paenibacillus pinihumi]|uniref:YqzE family protein n=1 Tax=Paenibacillus pinihumi TaxID=669462 RepID=UPI00040DC37B|nr:YqzE family protein [Paenibacillus pinihumi]